VRLAGRRKCSLADGLDVPVDSPLLVVLLSVLH